MNRLTSRSLAVSVTVLALVFGTGYAIGHGEKLGAAALSPILGKSVKAPEGVDLDQFWKAWKILDERFAGEATSTPAQEKVWGAIKGLTGAYDDPYTVFLTPDEMSVFEENISGSFSGAGMEIAVEDGLLTVITPLKDSPAERAGLKPGDKIIQIGDRSTENMSVDEAVTLIRGEAGTKVSITYYRKGIETPRTVSITRQNIAIPTLDTKVLDNDIYYARLYSFSANSADLFKDMIADYKKSGKESLILDLRNNPGGYLGAAVDISSHFLPEGKVIVTEDYRTEEKDDIHRSKGLNTFPKSHKIVVLINGGSASASEILAGALKEHGRATLVGQTSFGKGSVQELIPVSKDTALKVTVARWLTPDGNSLSEHGIEPNVVVEYPENTTEDLDLNKAIELLTTKR